MTDLNVLSVHAVGNFLILFKMATGGSSSSTQQDSIIDYNDIMIIGKTGMGKTTTADKLLIANPQQLNYQGAQYSDPIVEREHVRADDLNVWLLSDAPNEIERVTQRLKNLVFFRGLNEPHEEINKSHSDDEDDDTVTLSFELISNESTKVRVLDIPGFFGEGDAGACTSAGEKAQHSVNVAIGRMRMILQIQATMRMNFCRILYFLPMHGALKRLDSYLETELATLAKYFGKSIFNSMVVAATLSSEAFDDGNRAILSDASLAKTKRNFVALLSRVFPGEKSLPDPPVVYISKADTCEAVYAKVMGAHVACDHIKLKFDTLICARCGSRAKLVNSEKVAVYTDETETNTKPYEESKCHPLFIPKYTKFDRILGGIAHVITYLGLWPNFRSLHEVCVRCQKQPGSDGCVPVMTRCEMYGEYFMVDHTNNTTEKIKVIFEDVIPDQKTRSRHVVAKNEARNPRSVTSAPATQATITTTQTTQTTQTTNLTRSYEDSKGT